MPGPWRLILDFQNRYGLPVVSARINGLWEISFALSTGDPWSILSPQTLQAALLDIGTGRRVIPTAAGPVIAQTITTRRLRVYTQDEPLEFAPFTFAVSHLATTLEVGGVLGTDFLSRFRRMAFDSAGGRQVLTLEE